MWRNPHMVEALVIISIIVSPCHIHQWNSHFAGDCWLVVNIEILTCKGLCWLVVSTEILSCRGLCWLVVSDLQGTVFSCTICKSFRGLSRMAVTIETMWRNWFRGVWVENGERRTYFKDLLKLFFPGSLRANWTCSVAWHLWRCSEGTRALLLLLYWQDWLVALHYLGSDGLGSTSELTHHVSSSLSAAKFIFFLICEQFATFSVTPLFALRIK